MSESVGDTVADTAVNEATAPSTGAASDSTVPFTEALRGGVDFILVLLIAATIFKGFIAEGYFVPSGSMAPGLLGFHLEATCPSCGYTFAMGRDEGDWVPPNVSCPMCRRRFPLDDLPTEAGDRLLVLKGIYDLQPPHRWETVVFRNPNDAAQAYVKRVIGLPGESVQIDRGDVLINGRIARKTFDQFLSLCLPVYDHATTRRSPDAGDRLIPQQSTTGWLVKGDRVHVETFPSRPPEILEYRHLDDTGREKPISDQNSYNADHPFAGEGNVRDLLVRVRVHHDSGNGYISVTYRLDAANEIDLRLSPSSGRLELFKNHRLVKAQQGRPWSGETREITLAYWDQRIAVRIDGEAPWPDIDVEDRFSVDLPAVSRPVRLAAQDFRGEIDQFRIDRDVHYRSMPRSMMQRELDRGEYQLAGDEYFMLGDNSAVSNDSRSWDIPAVPERLLVGKPIMVHLPTWTWHGNILGKSVQIAVPDFGRMRRIH